MKSIGAVLSIASGVFVASGLAEVRSANVNDEVKAVRAEIASNSVYRIPRNGSRYYSAWYVDQCTVAEREAILQRNVAAHRRWMKLKPTNAPAAHADLGDAYVVAGRWKEARPELEAALAAGDGLDA
jgi:expansin (peptidoglycan-binding protein)